MFHCRWLLEQRGEMLENVGFGDDGANEQGKNESESSSSNLEKDDSGEPDSSWYAGATPGPPPAGGQ